MEAVRAFNNELSSLYETKPPISRAKMATVTKTAMKAIKFYKHVVQSVEKFIQKCKPEYKVPGLYVIDSVVRQSRHQFGLNKDVFAPRFTKNIIATFQNLFKCPGDERSKIVRVLNLWQKNEVFPSEIIQPLLDLAADPTKPSLIAAAQSAVDKVVAANTKPASQPNKSSSSAGAGDAQGALSHTAAESMLATQNDMLNTVTQLLQNTNTSTSLDAQQQQLQQLQTLQQQLIQQTAMMQAPTGGGPPLIDANLLAQIQTLTNQLLQKTESKQDEDSGFNKKLLDFDYGDSEDEEDKKHSLAGEVRNIFGDKGLMRQIHQVSQSIQSNTQLSGEIDMERRRILEQQQAEFDQQISQPAGAQYSGDSGMQGGAGYHGAEEGEYTGEDALQDEDFREHHHQLRDREREESRDRRGDRRGSSRRSRDRSRTPKRRKRSRSRSRDRRRRSRSRDRHRRSKSKDREKRERERERRKQGIPAVRANFVTICTCTIWIGHLNKFTLEEDLKTAVENYGAVASINMVPPRGCAYVVMEKRKDANKAVDRLRGQKVNGNTVKTAWAQSTGMRSSGFKDSWDLDEGAIYIPYDQLPADLSHFLDGAIIDQDSLPENLKEIAVEKGQLGTVNAANSQQATSQAAPTSVPMMTPPSHMISMMGGGMGAGPMPPGMMAPGMMMSPMQQRGGPPVSMPPSSMPGPPGMPPALPPGAPPLPPQMMPPGAPPSPALPPGVRPPVGGVLAAGMSIGNTAASTLAQNIQNIMSSAPGVLPTSPSVPPRPGFTPGSGQVPRFGFNPNLPPPGFRLPPPPPGFGGPPVGPPMMPGGMMPGGPPSEGSGMPSGPRPLGPKQPEMMWPPDSNEMDEDNDDEEDEAANSNGPTNGPGDEARSGPPGPMGGQFGGPPPGLGQMPGQDSPGMRMRGPVPLRMQQGGFPPGPPGGPPGQMWGMGRMGGPRGMRGMGPRGQPDMFPGMGGPRGGPPLMGGPPFMGPAGRGFPPRAPVSLLDLPDMKPAEGANFEGQSFNYENEFQEEEDEVNNKEENEGQEDNENEQPPAAAEEENEANNIYPFNSWSSVNRNNNRSRDRKGDDERGNRGRDNERDSDYSRDRDRRASRDWDRDRSRDRDRGDRDRDRGDRDRDRRRDRDDRREDRADRGGNRRERQRRSRWCEIDENIDPEQGITKIVQEPETPANVEESVGESGEGTVVPSNDEVPTNIEGAGEPVGEDKCTDSVPASDNLQVENQSSGNIADTDTETLPPEQPQTSLNVEHSSTSETLDNSQNDMSSDVNEGGQDTNEIQQENEPIDSGVSHIQEPVEAMTSSDVEPVNAYAEESEMSVATDNHGESHQETETNASPDPTSASTDPVQSNGPMPVEQENGQVETRNEEDIENNTCENIEAKVAKEISQDLEEGELSS